MITSTSSAANLLQFQQDLFWHIVSSNTEYLGISVSIILGAGILLSVLLYFLSFQPLLKRISTQETTLAKLGADIETERKLNERRFSELADDQKKMFLENKEALSSLSSAVEKDRESNVERINSLVKEQEQNFAALKENLEEAEKKELLRLETVKEDTKRLFRVVEKKVQIMEMYELWYRHYIWDTYKIPRNILRTLISCLEKSIELKEDFMTKTCLDAISSLFKETKPSEMKDVELFERLDATFPNIIGEENLEIVDNIKAHMSKIREGV